MGIKNIFEAFQKFFLLKNVFCNYFNKNCTYHKKEIEYEERKFDACITCCHDDLLIDLFGKKTINLVKKYFSHSFCCTYCLL